MAWSNSLVWSSGSARLGICTSGRTKAAWLIVLYAALGILAQAIILSVVVTAERPLGLRRHGVLLTLCACLLAEVLVIVVVVVSALSVGGVVGRVLIGRRAEGAACLLLSLGLRRLRLSRETALELALRCRSAGLLLLGKGVERLRCRERSGLLGCGLAKPTILLGTRRRGGLDGCKVIGG